MSLSIPKGTRDFSPAEMVKRTYIFDTIRSVFKLFGYQPIETPAMENLTTLMGKYGEEGDKLLFKVLNSGNYLQKTNPDSFDPEKLGVLTNLISEKGLRYDLTVPFARYVVQHRNDIVLPFKRYQIQPVWRADRPQKGRYREFFQCDADVVGSTSLLNEAELVQIVDLVFAKLGVDVLIKINNRKILSGIAEVMGQSDKIIDITVAIDKIEKIGFEAIKNELINKGVTAEQINILQPILELKGSTPEKLDGLARFLHTSEIGLHGIAEVRSLFNYIEQLGIAQETELDLSLARGLNYYTGAIFEVKAKGVEMGSICGGGRYDNLTGIFGMKDVSGVGISFGADRIYDVLGMLNLFPENTLETTRVLFVNMGEEEEVYSLKAIRILREKGVVAEIYPDQVKLKKQLDYANRRNIPFVVIVGEDELKASTYMLKDMNAQKQCKVSLQELVSSLEVKELKYA